MFFYTQGVSYHECLDLGLLNKLNYTSDSSDIIGARGAECNITCAQRYWFDFICYSDVGIFYDIWYWILYFAYIVSFTWTCYCTYMVYKYDNYKITTTPQTFTLFGTILTVILRMIWLIGIYNGKTPDVFNGIVIFDVAISKTVQSIHLVLFLGIIFVWKNIVDSTTTLSRIGQKQNIKTLKYIAIIYTSVALILVPISVCAQLWIPKLGIVTGVIFLAFIITLITSSIKYSYAINKILTNNTNHTKLIKSIKLINNIFFIIGSFEIILIICIYFRLFTNPMHKLFINWFLLHLFEIIFLNLFASTVSHKARYPNLNTNRQQSITVANSINASTYTHHRLSIVKHNNT